MNAHRCLVWVCLLLVQAAQADQIQPGRWAVEMVLSMDKENSMPPSTNTICLQDINDMVNAGTGCHVHTTSTSGTHVNLGISCDVSGLKMEGTGSLDVAPTKVDGTLNLAMQMAGDQPVQAVTAMHANRVGDCQK